MKLDEAVVLARSLAGAAEVPKVAAKKGSKKVAAPEAAKSAPDAKALTIPSGPAWELSSERLREVFSAVQGTRHYRLHVRFDPEALMATVGPIQVFANLKESGEVVETRPTLEELQQDRFFPEVSYWFATDLAEDALEPLVQIPETVSAFARETLSVQGAAEEDGEGLSGQEGPVEAASAAEAEAVPVGEAAVVHAAQEEAKKAASSVLRVDSERIDRILNLVGELTVNKSGYGPLDASLQYHLMALGSGIDQMRGRRSETSENEAEADEEISQVSQHMAGLREMAQGFRTAWQELERITSDLRTQVMKIRMVTVGQIFNRIPRIVRDLSRERGKTVEVTTSGEETEMDKSVIEELLDPVIHIVRNSVDHGFETPEERKASGKNPVGTFHLSARHEGNLIILKLKDDGRGIDPERVYQSAVKKGVIKEGTQLTDREKIHLIFEPGFSTAEKVTEISGRGVGMDVVRRRIEGLSGTVSVDTKLGEGTEITLKLPLTLTIMQALLVQVSTEVFAVPITAILETLRIDEGQLTRLEDREVLDVRGDVLSVLHCARIYGLREVESEDRYAVIVAHEDGNFALIVDNLIGEQDIVIKALKNRLLQTRGVAGAANLGDGSISFILDVASFVAMGLEKTRSENISAGV